MKKILKIDATGNVMGPVSGLIKAINLPHPETPDKQRVTLTDGENDLDCNIYGKHLHIPHDKVGEVVTMSWEKAQTAYLSVFDGGGRCLTLRDGVIYAYRAPKEGSVPTSEDRVVSMAKHYAFCFQMANHQLKKVCPEITIEAVQPVATVLFLDTKHTVKVKVGEADNEPLWEKPQPKGEAPKPEPSPSPKPEPQPEPSPKESPKPPKGSKPKPSSEPEKKPEPEAKSEEPQPKPDETPAPTPEGDQAGDEIPVQLTEKDHDTLLKLDYPKFCEKAAAAFSYNGKDATKVAWRSLFVKVADSYKQSGLHPKVWMDLFDEIWQKAPIGKQEGMDRMISAVMEKNPNANDNEIHRAVAIMSGTIED